MGTQEDGGSSAVSCVICGRVPVDRCHVKTKKSGGSMEDFNIFLACREHHSMQHALGILTFYNRFPQFKDHLSKKGWFLLNGKLFNPLTKKQ